MNEDDSFFYFTNKEDFNKFTSCVHPDAYSEFERFSSHFQETVSKLGPDTFSPTLSFYASASKDFVGVVTCRDTVDKEDLYAAMAEMLYLPTALKSSLFIVANDVRVRKIDKVTGQVNQNSEPQDAMVVTYVTEDHCIIYTCPYAIDDNNDIIWLFEDSFLSKIATSKDNLPIGDMVELFFIFSHTESGGPFSPDEVLSYLNAKGFTYKIFHPERLNQKTRKVIGIEL